MNWLSRKSRVEMGKNELMRANNDTSLYGDARVDREEGVNKKLLILKNILAYPPNGDVPRVQ